MAPDDIFEIPICPVCDRAMVPVGPIEGFEPPPDSNVFECKRCPVIATPEEMPSINENRVLH
jgi:hypothetical protein